MEESILLDETVVTYDADDIINGKNSGHKVSKDNIEKLPTLSRSLQDFNSNIITSWGK